MYGQEKHRGPRNASLALDMIHIIIGILIVVLAVISFLNPEGNLLLFPLIFLLAASLNMINGIYRIHQSGRDKKKKMSGIGLIVAAILLAILSIASAVSIWWG
ncbi:hypothetical protein C0033_26450 [Clostridium sp. chh4-2]|uniref:DUF6637 family protein n=1 Tax=Clostridium sp. chh4-2 TaxID=2067550 RepID=UPI000CCECB7D|nr:DUF6637 family protein [Clostridium sp. chh4-2]PNV58970.1 hypothetical protein C0033_26450 [Clostridium sp. chh4-2]